MVRVWDLRSGASRELAKQGAPVTWITFSQDGKWLASVAEDGMVRLWKEDLPQDPAGLRAWLAAATPDSLAHYGAPLETAPPR